MSITVAENNTLGFGFTLDPCITMGKQSSFCQLVDSTDSTPFQATLTASESVLFNGFKVKASGTTDGTAADLDDSTATFRDDGIRQYWTVKNTTDNTYHQITNATSNREIELLIGTLASGKDYSITDWLFSNATWDESTTYVTASANAVIRRYYSLLPYRYYKVTVVIATYTAGELDVQLGNNVIGTIDSAGVHTFYGKMDTSDGRICILTGDGSCNMVIAGVNAYEVSTVGVAIVQDGVVVDSSIDGEYVTYSGLTAQIDYDWSNLNDGCYSVLVWDLVDFYADLISDGQFNFEQGVSTGTNTSIVNTNIIDASATFEDDGVQDGTNAWDSITALNTSTGTGIVKVTGRTNQTTLVTETQSPIWTGQNYYISYWFTIQGSATITPGNLAFSGSGITDIITPINIAPTQLSCFVDFTVDNYAGGTVRVLVLDSSFNAEVFTPIVTADGNYSTQIGAFGSLNNIAYIGFSYVGSAGGDGMDVSDVRSYFATNNTGASFLNGDSSECIKVGTHDCTLQLTATNDENAFGINYEDFSMTHSLRLDARLRAPRYPLDAEVYKFSNGDRRLLTGERDKFEQLEIKEVPEYIHNMVSIMLVHDTFQIDGTTYVKGEGDYEPVWRRTSQLAPCIYEVQKGTQNNENPSC